MIRKELVAASAEPMILSLLARGESYGYAIIQEVKARGARVIAVATEGNREISQHVDDVLWTPKTPALLSALTTVIPLQLFAYELATSRGLNVDQPRNLAKTVTVE